MFLQFVCTNAFSVMFVNTLTLGPHLAVKPNLRRPCHTFLWKEARSGGVGLLYCARRGMVMAARPCQYRRESSPVSCFHQGRRNIPC